MNFAGECTHFGPSTNVFNNAIGMNEIETIIRNITKVADVILNKYQSVGLKSFDKSDIVRQIYTGYYNVLLFQKIETQCIPIVKSASEIDYFERLVCVSLKTLNNFL